MNYTGLDTIVDGNVETFINRVIVYPYLFTLLPLGVLDRLCTEMSIVSYLKFLKINTKYFTSIKLTVLEPPFPIVNINP